MNILITAAATVQAYQLQRSLNINSNDSVFLADSEDLPQILLKDKSFVKIPSGDSASFAHLLLTICLDNTIETVYPLRRAEVLALAEARQLFDEYGIKVMVPGKNEIVFFLHKGIKGEIIIKDDAEHDRGVFLKDESTSELQLFTVD